MRGHFRYLRFKTFPMTPRTPQCEVFWTLLSSSKHSGVPEGSKPPTFPRIGLHPHTWPKWGYDSRTLSIPYWGLIKCLYFADTTERGDRRVKGSPKTRWTQGYFTDNSVINSNSSTVLSWELVVLLTSWNNQVVNLFTGKWCSFKNQIPAQHWKKKTSAHFRPQFKLIFIKVKMIYDQNNHFRVSLAPYLCTNIIYAPKIKFPLNKRLFPFGIPLYICV